MLAAEALLGEGVLESSELALFTGATGSLAYRATLDSLGAVMFTVVTTVGFAVHLYSLWYIEGDPGQAHFIALISSFCGCILVTLSRSGLTLLFVG